MAVEIIHTPKRLSQHALPLLGLAAVGLILSVIALNRYSAVDPRSQTAVTKSLITPMIHIHSGANGSAKVSLGYPAALQPSASTGPVLGSAPLSAGQTAQLLLMLPTAHH
ncbi:MAG TPA: hypothetical protein VIJ68_03760 [Candidatus Saccharimonadales bacterium]